MECRRNVGSTERWARVAAGLLLVGWGLVGLHASLAGLLVALAGAASVLTAAIGYCPAYALAGRKPLSGR